MAFAKIGNQTQKAGVTMATRQKKKDRMQMSYCAVREIFKLRQGYELRWSQ